MLGYQKNGWQNVNKILSLFAKREKTARIRYRKFVAKGIAVGRRPDLNRIGDERYEGGSVLLGLTQSAVSKAVQRGEKLAFEKKLKLRR